MITYCLDTNIISYLLRPKDRKGNINLSSINIGKRIKEEIDKGSAIKIHPITYYEGYRGLLSANVGMERLDAFETACKRFGILSLNTDVFKKSAEIYADLKETGKIIEDADILIGATCLINNIILVTNNEEHFKRIKGLTIENWC